MICGVLLLDYCVVLSSTVPELSLNNALQKHSGCILKQSEFGKDFLGEKLVNQIRF